ncbi:MAG: hypothetical protein IJL89_05155, partial [Firmicutes bacterium]|nr:hypothetical protein [Bacillota bacterium]
GETGRSFAERFEEHFKHWFGNYSEHYIGICKRELLSGKYSILIKILAKEYDIYKRKQLEARYIKTEKPYLQFSSYRKYRNTDYNGIDLCIENQYRRDAFLDALSQHEKGA